MATLGLDSETWDLCVDADGNWPVLDECESVTQNIRIALQTCRGEWFLDSTLGVPTSSVLGASPDLDAYEAALKLAILDVPGVDRLTSFSLERNNTDRSLCSNFTGVTTCGDEFGATV